MYLKEFTNRKLFVPMLLLFTWVSCSSGKMAEIYNRGAAKPESKATEIVKVLQIRKGQTVADLGSGGGYFTYLFAEEVGAKGKVLAEDIDSDLLAIVKKGAVQKGLGQIETVQGSQDNPSLPENSVDLAFSRDMYHHLENPVAYFKNLIPSLKKGGKVAVIDYMPDDSNNFYNVHGHNTPKDKIQKDLEKAGYRKVKEYDFLSTQSFQIFQVR